MHNWLEVRINSLAEHIDEGVASVIRRGKVPETHSWRQVPRSLLPQWNAWSLHWRIEPKTQPDQLNQQWHPLLTRIPQTTAFHSFRATAPVTRISPTPIRLTANPPCILLTTLHLAPILPHLPPTPTPHVRTVPQIPRNHLQSTRPTKVRTHPVLQVPPTNQ